MSWLCLGPLSVFHSDMQSLLNFDQEQIVVYYYLHKNKNLMDVCSHMVDMNMNLAGSLQGA